MSRRAALVIGNGAYAYVKPELKNPVNDARAIEKALSRLGFSVKLGLDLGRHEMENCLDDFERDIDEAYAALFFFAGHGIQGWDGRNYLIPVDAKIEIERHLRQRSFVLDEILHVMDARSANSLIFLDSCRDAGPLISSIERTGLSRGPTARGLAEIKPPNASFIAFATAPGQVAADGPADEHSPFTRALLEHIEQPDVSVDDMMMRVRKSVRQATGGVQTPWNHSSLEDPFFFNPRPRPIDRTREQLSTDPVVKMPESGGTRAAESDLWRQDEDKPAVEEPEALRWQGSIITEPQKVRAHARDLLAELEGAAWEELPSPLTSGALRGFLAHFPDGANAKAANASLAELEKNEREYTSGLEVLGRFLLWPLQLSMAFLGFGLLALLPELVRGDVGRTWSKFVAAWRFTEPGLFWLPKWQGVLLIAIVGALLFRVGKSITQRVRRERRSYVVTALCVVSDGRLAVGSEDGEIRFWDLSPGAETARLDGHSNSADARIEALCVLSDGRLASGGRDNTLRLRDVTRAAGTAHLDGHSGWVTALCVLPDGRLASGSGDKTIRLWDVTCGAETVCLDGHSSGIEALCVLPDGRLASGSWDNTIRLWDVTRAVETARLDGHSSGIEALCMLPDGRLASGSRDNTIRLWDVTRGAETARLDGHSGWVTALCVLPDGRLVSASNDHTIRLWDLTRGAAITRFDAVTALCALPDGRLASGSSNNIIRLWDMTEGMKFLKSLPKSRIGNQSSVINNAVVSKLS
jgi:putative hemolysin